MKIIHAEALPFLSSIGPTVRNPSLSYFDHRSGARPGRPAARSPLGHLYSDLNRLYRLHLARRTLRGGDVGMKTRRERRIVIESALRDLHSAGLKLRRLKNFRAKHVYHILRSWRGRNLKASTLSTYVSHLRTLCSWIQKPQLVALIDAFIAREPQLVRRRTVADVDRSAHGAGVCSVTILQRAVELDPRFAAQLALIIVFGLRSEEAWLFRPHLALRCDGTVQVLWGTKGGRPRVLPIELSEAHHAVLVWARTFAQTRSESMIPRGWTVQRWRRRYYRLCAKVGLTRRQCGVTPHAFRHGMLLDLYTWLTGVPASVRGGTLAIDDPAADRAARIIVSNVAGHAEVHITSAYLGGMRAHRDRAPGIVPDLASNAAGHNSDEAIPPEEPST
jgi:integrase